MWRKFFLAETWEISLQIHLHQACPIWFQVEAHRIFSLLAVSSCIAGQMTSGSLNNMDGGIGVVMKLRSFIAAMMVVLFLGFSGPVSAGERFVDNGDGTVTDTELNLMWAAGDNQVDISFKDASRWTRFTFGYTTATHYDDWRLPSDGELKSLFAAGKKSKSVTTDCGMYASIIPQIRLSCAWVWATHKVTGEPVVFNFDYGSRFGNPDDITGCRALPVRSIPKP